MGRTGTAHAWEQEGIVPDIQTLGKCLGGGYQPIAGVLISPNVIEALEQGTGWVQPISSMSMEDPNSVLIFL